MGGGIWGDGTGAGRGDGEQRRGNSVKKEAEQSHHWRPVNDGMHSDTKWVMDWGEREQRPNTLEQTRGVWRSTLGAHRRSFADRPVLCGAGDWAEVDNHEEPPVRRFTHTHSKGNVVNSSSVDVSKVSSSGYGSSATIGASVRRETDWTRPVTTTPMENGWMPTETAAAAQQSDRSRHGTKRDENGGCGAARWSLQSPVHVYEPRSVTCAAANSLPGTARTSTSHGYVSASTAAKEGNAALSHVMVHAVGGICPMGSCEFRHSFPPSRGASRGSDAAVSHKGARSRDARARLEPVLRSLARDNIERSYALRATGAAGGAAGPNLQVPVCGELDTASRDFCGVKSSHVLRQQSHKQLLAVNEQVQKQAVLADRHQPVLQWLPPECMLTGLVPPEAPSPRGSMMISPTSRCAPRCTLNPVQHSANITFRSLRTGALIARPTPQRLQASGAQTARAHVAQRTTGLGLLLNSNLARCSETGLRPRKLRVSGGVSTPRLANAVACQP